METTNTEYEMSETPIKDTSVLGTAGKNLCDNIDVYWLTQVTRHVARHTDDDEGKPTECRKQ